MKIAISGMDSRVEAWVKEYLLGRMQRVRIGGQLSGEVTVTSGVLQERVFLAYVNDIWGNTESTIRLFTDDCIIYKEIINKDDIEKSQKDLDRLGEWVVENKLKQM